jgi:hypothetical protein
MCLEEGEHIGHFSILVTKARSHYQRDKRMASIPFNTTIPPEYSIDINIGQAAVPHLRWYSQSQI